MQSSPRKRTLKQNFKEENLGQSSTKRPNTPNKKVILQNNLKI